MNNRCRKNVKWTAGALLLAPLLVICVRYLDVPVALFVKEYLFGNRGWSNLASDLPDLLLMAVLATTVAAFSLYLVRSNKGIYDDLTRLAQLVTWAAPASFMAKGSSKFIFGRVNTRQWLQEPALYGFHWCQGLPGCEGFPSGHMVVAVTLLAALARFYPKSLPFCYFMALLLGVALIVTNYHFLSDVIAGAALGVLVEALVCSLLFRRPQRFRGPGLLNRA